MSFKPPSVEYGFRQEWSTKDDFVRYNHQRENQQIVRLVSGTPTTNGVVYSAISCSTAASSKTSAVYTVGSTYTLAWAGLEGFYVDELEVGLTIAARSTAAQSTFGYSWQIKDDDATTWQNVTTFKTYKGTTLTWDERTLSHSKITTGTGYNKLPLELRLRFYSKSAKGKMKIKSSSYVAIKAKKYS